MCCGENRGKNFWIKRAIFIPIVIAAGIFILGYAVMQLWNCILVPVLGVITVTFWQALGILVLSKILFGGFRHGHGHPRFNHAHKWMHMSPEEREKMRAEWKTKCCEEGKQE